MSRNERQSAKKHLAAKQLRAVQCLLTERNTKEAATKAGVSEATIHRWLSEPAFDAAFRQARSSLLERALTSLQASTQEAVETLKTIMKDQAAPTSSRVRAARSIIELALKARETLEIEDRLRALEAKLIEEQPK